MSIPPRTTYSPHPLVVHSLLEAATTRGPANSMRDDVDNDDAAQSYLFIYFVDCSFF